MTVTNCMECGRLLDRADDPLSESTIYECAACLLGCEAGDLAPASGKPPPDLAGDGLRTWLAPILAARRERNRMIDEALDKARASGRLRDDDMNEWMTIVAMQRLIQQGMGQDEARAKIVEAFSKPLSFHIPDFDEL